MKSKIKKFAIICLAGILAACLWTACNEKEPNEEPAIPEEEYEWEGYVIGYSSCAGVRIENGYGKPRGHILVSTDLQDSLLTYNFPDSLFLFPEDCFSLFHGEIAFPEEYRYAYKVKMNYRMASEEERGYLICNGMYNWKLLLGFDPVEIVIESIKAIEP